MGKIDKYSKVAGTFIYVDGEYKQIGIGDVIDRGDFVSVETLGGCSEEALKSHMQKIANEVHKVVKAPFNNEEIVVEPTAKEE